MMRVKMTLKDDKNALSGAGIAGAGCARALSAKPS